MMHDMATMMWGMSLVRLIVIVNKSSERGLS